MGNFLPTFYVDVTTIENNRQVGVNIGMMLVAIFRINYSTFDTLLLFQYMYMYYDNNIFSGEKRKDKKKKERKEKDKNMRDKKS